LQDDVSSSFEEQMEEWGPKYAKKIKFTRLRKDGMARLLIKSMGPKDTWADMQTHTFHPFSRIDALEIREAIYAAIVAQEPKIVDFEDFRFTTKAIWCPSFLPNICRTLRAILKEVAPVVIRNFVFQVSNYSGNLLLHAFLGTLDKGFQSVRELHFNMFYYFNNFKAMHPVPGLHDRIFNTGNADIEIMVLCPGLHTVQLAMHVIRLVQGTTRPFQMCRGVVLISDHPDSYEPVPINDLVQRYGLEQIFGCEGLRKIAFKYTDNTAVVQKSCKDQWM
jgi:hypothetical protein